MKLFFIFLFLAFVFWRAEAVAANLHFGCEEYGAEVDFEFQGQLLLHKDLIDASNTAEVKSAIVQQLHYARGYFINSRSSVPYSITLSAENPEVKILTIKVAPYGQNAIIDAVIHPSVKIENEYIKKALMKKVFRSKDPARLVTYKVKTSAYYCGPQASMSKVKALLPLDPYLAYWTVSAKSRRPIRWNQALERINPCANAELADIPHPEYYWYFWDPNKMGYDANRKSYNCANLLKKEHRFTEFTAKLTAKSSLVPANLVLAKTIEVSAVFGIIDEHRNILPWTEIIKTLTAEKDISWEAIDLQVKKATESVRIEDRDRGSNYFIGFLKQLPKTMVIEKIEKGADPQEIVVRGTLKESKTPTRLSVWFGPTDVLGQEPPAHWEFLKRALSTSQYVIYNGHSGLGNNLKISNLLEATGAKASELFKNSPPYQLIAYFSCYSYGYFGEDVVEQRRKYRPGSSTEIILTGTEFTSERGPLGLLSFVDRRSLSNNVKIDNSGWLHPRDQIILQSDVAATDKEGL
jgi:hypothetical protein